MKDKFLIAEQYLFKDSFYNALDTLVYIAENDSGNEWGGKARYAISWIYENKIKDIDKALESYTILAEEYPKSEFAKIAKNKIKIPKIEVPVDTTKSDSLQIEIPKEPNDEKKDEEKDIEDEKKEDNESELKDEESTIIDMEEKLNKNNDIEKNNNKSILKNKEEDPLPAPDSQ